MDDKIISEELNREEENVSKNPKKKEKKVSFHEYNKLYEQFEKAMATAAHHQNLSNYYKNEYDKMLKYRSQSVVESLLPVLDSFEFAFKGDLKTDEAKNYRAGFEFVHKLMVDALENEGLVIVKPKINDEFDSNTMQVLETVYSEDESLNNKVASVLLNGYLLKDRLIRAANVNVYTNKKEENVEEQKENKELN